MPEWLNFGKSLFDSKSEREELSLFFNCKFNSHSLRVGERNIVYKFQMHGFTVKSQRDQKCSVIFKIGNRYCPEKVMFENSSENFFPDQKRF